MAFLFWCDLIGPKELDNKDASEQIEGNIGIKINGEIGMGNGNLLFQIFQSFLVEMVVAQAMEDADKRLFQITPVRLLYLLYLFLCYCCCCCEQNEIKVASNGSIGLRSVGTIVCTSNTSRTSANQISKSVDILSSAALLVTAQSTTDSY